MLSQNAIIIRDLIKMIILKKKTGSKSTDDSLWILNKFNVENDDLNHRFSGYPVF